MGDEGGRIQRRPALTRRLGGAALALAMAVGLVGASVAEAGHKGKPHKTRHVLFVGNNWDGTADVLYPRGPMKRIHRLNIIPDYEERMAEIMLDPVRLGYFLAIRSLIGEGHDQFVDDMYLSLIHI